MIQKESTLPFILALTVGLGVLLHDTQIDQATSVALTAPAILATYAIADSAMKSNDHTHVEKFAASRHLGAFRINVPRIQPRDDNRHIAQSKKLYFGGGADTSLWPSV